MSRVATKGPRGQKQPKPEKAPRKRMRQVSAKRAAHQASKEGKADLAYMGLVKTLPCAVCGAPGPNDAHHCRDQPPAEEPHGYKRLPCAGRKSHDRDTIPLCKAHHQNGPEAYHEGPATWRAKNGPDYTHIPATRAAVAAMTGEIDF